MTRLSSKNKKVSLSDHVKRRRSSAHLSSYGTSGAACAGGSGSSVASDCDDRYGPSAAQHHHHGSGGGSAGHPPRAGDGEHEGSYDSHAASYGNYDAPSGHYRSYGTSDHGCYAAESHIGNHHTGRYNSHGNGHVGASSEAAHMAGRDGLSDSEIDGDLEGQRCADDMATTQPSYSRSRGSGYKRSGSSSRQRRLPPPQHRSDHGPDPALRLSQATTVHMGPQDNYQPSWEDESSCYPKSQASVATASTANTSGTSGSASVLSGATGRSSVMEEEAIRQGILDLSTLIATYVAGALSFVIGIFLTLISPFVKVVKLILGDVRGLLGDVGFVQDLGSLWRMYRDLRRRGDRGGGSGGSTDGGGRRDQPSHDRHHPHGPYYDDEGTEATSVYTDASPQPAQYVGGWHPRMGGSGVSANSASTGASRSSNPWARGAPSRSHSSLPLVYEDQYQDPPPNANGAMYQDRRHHGGGGVAPVSMSYYPQRNSRHMVAPQQQQQPLPPMMPPYEQPQQAYHHPSSPVKNAAYYGSQRRGGREHRSRCAVA